MGKNASMVDTKENMESPQLLGNDSVDRNSQETSLEQSALFKLPKIANQKMTLTPVPSLPIVANRNGSQLQHVSER